MSILPATEQRRQRLRFVLLLVFGIGTTLLLAIFANREGISLYYTPTQVNAGKAPINRTFRVGGMVQQGSLKQLPDGLTIRFVVFDAKYKITVQHKGETPDMFKENTTAVAKGRLDKNCIFISDKVLAKHDEKYIPESVKKSLHKKTGKPLVLSEINCQQYQQRLLNKNNKT